MTHPAEQLRRWVPSVAAADAQRLTDAADEIEASILDFDPMDGLVDGLRRLNSAMAAANRVYTELAGAPLFDAPRKKPMSACGLPDEDPPMVA